MKNHTPIIGLLLLAFLTSCDLPLISDGKAKAEYNGELWKAKLEYGAPSFSNPDNISLGFIIKENGFQRENLFISNLPLKKGIYTCVEKSEIDDHENRVGIFYITLSHDGDVVSSFYNLAQSNSHENVVEVTKVNPGRNYIEGTFSAVFHKDTTGIDISDDPLVVEFTDGSFKAYYED